MRVVCWLAVSRQPQISVGGCFAIASDIRWGLLTTTLLAALSWQQLHYSTPLKRCKIPIKVALEFKLQSCKGILALRHQYQHHTSFIFIRYRDFVDRQSNFHFLQRKLPNIAATNVLFDMEFYNLHQTSGTER